MKKKLEVKTISADEFAPTRLGIVTAAVGAATLITAVVIYYWPIIEAQLSL